MLKPLRRLLAGLAFLLPLGSYAQTLDFDSVCATPPCDPASLYAGVGVSFAGGGASIVAAGTNGLTGTNGGRFMQVSVFPFQNTITLTRTSVYATLDVARATGTTAGQTFTLQALNNGAPTGAPVTVTLGAVNAWSTVVLSVPGGFNGIFLDTALGGATKTYGIDNVRIFGTCNGFSDVLPTDSYCNATEWLANRGVTLGCVAGQYCPTSNVTRAQMALFMNRLGTALTPTVLFNRTSDSVDPATVPGGRATICTTTHTPTRPSMASATGTLVTYLPPGPGLYQFFIQYSTDGGTTWANPPGGNNTFATVGTGEGSAQTLVTPSMNLDVGRTYQFAGRVSRFTGTPGSADFYCYLQVRIENANPVSAPFDAADEQAPVPRN